MTTVSLDDGSNLHYIISAFPYTLLYAEFGYDLVCNYNRTKSISSDRAQVKPCEMTEG